ncbi:hypothetical protein B8W72_01775 [Pseudomonas putida]|uniref:Uncharacterized protein n=2 Tax=Pseudomonas putida TaxID=303 RepID=A0A1Y3LMF1_PSEPU|nr:hypothetical protein B8W72_01775 [Pseudomonas putida]
MFMDLSEEEMRRALFGDARSSERASGHAMPLNKNRSQKMTSKIRVVLQVGNVYEGGYEEVVYESSSLSALVAEMEAKKKYKKYKYVRVVSVVRV